MSTKITINNNGSIKVEGEFTIVDREGNQYDLAGREIIGLCRCGLSKNKPFCDGAHNGNFEHEAKAFACDGPLWSQQISQMDSQYSPHATDPQ